MATANSTGNPGVPFSTSQMNGDATLALHWAAGAALWGAVLQRAVHRMTREDGAPDAGESTPMVPQPANEDGGR
jgi:hypothetical protein